MWPFSKFAEEWSLISSAPTSAIAYALSVTGVVWLVLHFIYRERIEALKEQINLAKAGAVTNPDRRKSERRQAAIDSLSRDLSDAIHSLLNRKHPQEIDVSFIKTWSKDFYEWCSLVSKKLDDREFFTESDRLHFERLGVVPMSMFSGNPEYDRLVSMLNLKFQRLRDLIERVPQRPL
jgi:hypothetical protein